MKALIATVYDKAYEAYEPLFRYCCQKAYPEYECHTWNRDHWGEVFKPGPYTTAALRFLLNEVGEIDYDAYLITDIDILIRREQPDFIAQHLNHMKWNSLECYDNCDHGDHMPGVHFVTKEWWPRTKAAREKYLAVLWERPANLAEDEVILRKVVVESGLRTSTNAILWAVHGLHLGRFRNQNIQAIRFQPNEFEFLDSLMADDKFMELAEKSKEDPGFNHVWGNVMAVYNRRKPR